MKRGSILFLFLMAVSSCGVPSLYYWGGEQNGTTAYENLVYKDYKTQTPEAICNLVCLYEKMVSNPSDTRQAPPPGICAEYGYLLLLPSTAEAFTQKATPQQRRFFSGSDYSLIFMEKGKEMLQKEMELYPESQQFIAPLIKKIAR